jgi:hypothetical protein
MTGPAAGGKPPVAADTPFASPGETSLRGMPQQFGLSTSTRRPHHPLVRAFPSRTVGPWPRGAIGANSQLFGRNYQAARPAAP